MTEKNQDILFSSFLTVFQTPEHMKDWILTYLDIDLPLGHIDPSSNSSPIEAMYDAYATYRDDLCQTMPGFIWLSSRDSAKTLGGSLLNLLLMIHFKAQIAHMAATKKQAEKCLEYVNTALRKIEPYLVAAGRSIQSESKHKITILNEDTTISFIDVVTANLAGGNSQHCPVATFDELDTLSPQGLIGYKEALFIPTRYKNKGPLVIKYSTRKYAFGIFEKEIQNRHKTGEVLKQWNILDITEKCTSSRHRPDLPRVNRWVSVNLPLSNLDDKAYQALTDKEKDNYKKIEAYSGCASCPLLPVCETRLAARPDTSFGGLYKTIPFTIGQFNKTTSSPDMAEAQLLCRKASASGLVYPRFDENPKYGNKISAKAAYESFTGSEAPNGIDQYKLIQTLKASGIPIYAGVDWGFRHAFAIVVTAVVGNDWWLLHTFAAKGLEFDEMMQESLKIKAAFQPKLWYADTSQPMFIKEFNKKGMVCPKFKKDVMGGIEAVRGQIINAGGKRRLKLIDVPQNEFLLEGFRKHAFKLDTSGEPTQTPDDGEYADIMDTVRYLAQNLFKVKSNVEMYNQPVGLDGKLQRDPQQYKDWTSQAAESALFPSASSDPLDPSNPFSHILIQANRGEDE